jgi:hypothetical protein
MKRMFRGRVVVGVGLVVVAASILPVLSSGTAGASTLHWSRPHLVSNGGLNSVSCVSASFCAAAGDDALWTYTGHHWSVPTQFSGLDLAGVSCGSTTFCVAVGSLGGSPEIATYDGSLWSIAPFSSDAGALNAVSCIGTSFCEAVGATQSPTQSTLAATYSGGTWSVTATPTTSPANDYASLTSVSCASSTLCVAEGYLPAGPYEANLTEDFTSGTWSIATQPAPYSTKGSGPPYSDVSCPTTMNCLSVGTALLANPTYHDVGIAKAFNGNTWTAVTVPASSDQLSAVSCPQVADCIVGTPQSGDVLTYLNGVWSSPRQVSNSSILSVSCPTTRFCMAVDGSSAYTAR